VLNSLCKQILVSKLLIAKQLKKTPKFNSKQLKNSI